MGNLSDYRREFPVTENYTYFNHASVSPLPRRTAEAMERLAADAMHHGALHYPAWTRTVQDVRQAAARLLGCGPDEIALTKKTPPKGWRSLPMAWTGGAAMSSSGSGMNFQPTIFPGCGSRAGA